MVGEFLHLNPGRDWRCTGSYFSDPLPSVRHPSYGSHQQGPKHLDHSLWEHLVIKAESLCSSSLRSHSLNRIGGAALRELLHWTSC